MRGVIGPWLNDQWMGLLLATRPYVGLHTAPISPDDPTATEVVGVWYARKLLTWTSLSGTEAANALPISWSNVPEMTVVEVGLYTASTGSNLIVRCPYATPMTITKGKKLTIAAHDLYIELG